MHKIGNEVLNSARQLTPAVLQISEFLGLYHAELARILGIQCSDIGALVQIKAFIEPDTPVGQRAILFVRLYQHLYTRFAGDSVAICHWLRAVNPHMSKSPFYLLVDDGQLHWLLSYLEQQ